VHSAGAMARALLAACVVLICSWTCHCRPALAALDVWDSTRRHGNKTVCAHSCIHSITACCITLHVRMHDAWHRSTVTTEQAHGSRPVVTGIPGDANVYLLLRCACSYNSLREQIHSVLSECVTGWLICMQCRVTRVVHSRACRRAFFIGTA
jgi:hypothetical protein